MKRIIHLFLAMLGFIPSIVMPGNAPPFPFSLYQPNGLEFTARMFGDEYGRYLTTIDGYLIMARSDSDQEISWYYAILNGAGEMTCSDSLVSISRIPPRAPPAGTIPKIKRQNPGLPENAVLSKRDGSMKTGWIPAPDIFKPVVFLIDFPGQLPGKMTEHTKTREQFAGLIFGKDLNPDDTEPPLPDIYQMSVRDYFYEVSRHKFQITGDAGSVTDWTTSRESYDHYVADTQGLFGGASSLCTEMVRTLDPVVDFGQFDGDQDGYVDLIILIVEGWDNNTQYTFHGHKGLLPSYFTDPDVIKNERGFMMLDGIALKQYILVNEKSFFTYGTTGVRLGDIQPIGVFCHEIGHALGLPDLYDTGEEKETYGIGYWGLMGSGNWNQSYSPAYPCAWSRAVLGWIEPVLLSGLKDRELSIGPAESADSEAAYKLLIDTDNGHEYFLIENRQALGSDEHLMGTGLLIWHIDEHITDIYPYENSVNRTESLFGVNLMQADNKGHLYMEETSVYGNEGNAGDPFPGSAGNSSFTDDTVPGAMSYTYDRNMDGLIEPSRPSGIQIAEIAESGQNIIARVSCPEKRGYDLSYDEGNMQREFYGSDNLRTGIVFSPPSPGRLGQIRAVIPMDTSRARYLDYTIRLYEGFDPLQILPGNLIFTKSGNLECSVYQPLSWTCIPVEGAPAVRSGQNAIYYLEIEYQGEHISVGYDCDYYYHSITSGNSYCTDPDGVLRRFTKGDWNLRPVFIYDEGTDAAASIQDVPDYNLGPGYPNPFNTSTTFIFRIPDRVRVQIAVYDCRGRQVEILSNAVLEAGEYRIVWDARNMDSGIYICRMTAGPFRDSVKLLLIK